MNKITFAAIALLSSSSFSFASSSLPVISDKAFVETVNQALLPFQAKDAFAQAGCDIIDAHTIRPYTLEEALGNLQPCIAGIAASYGTSLSLRIDSESLVIETGLTTLTSPLLRDLNYGLQSRQNRLLGYPVQVRRGVVPARRSKVQAMVDGCIRTMVVSRIESGADFLQVYGGCLRREPSIKEVRPSQAHKLGLTMLVAGESPEVESLNGSVRVTALNGVVELLVTAYPDKVALP